MTIPSTAPAARPGPAPSGRPRALRTEPSVLRIGPVVLRVRPRAALATGVLVIVALGLALVALSLGDLPVPLPDVVAALVGQGDPGTVFVVHELRLPRVLLSLLVGAALGLSGGVFQGLTRNPLGSPDFVGLTTGASTGALIVLLVLGGSAATVSLGAFIGCAATTVVVYLLAYRGGTHGGRLVLVGVGIAAMLEAFNGFLVTRARLQDAQTGQLWMIGSLNGRGWEQVVPLGLAVLVLTPLALGLGRHLALLGLGDETAAALGVPVERVRTGLVVIAAVLVAVAAAASGPIGFVALCAPHLARRLARTPDLALGACAAMGAALLTGADLAAQRLPTPLPVGVLTAAVGGLYLTWLLAHEWRSGRG